MKKEPVLVSEKPNIFKFNSFYYIPSKEIIVDGILSIDDLKNKFHQEDENNEIIDLKKMYPTSIGLNLTNSCNLRCIYCFSETCNEKNETLSTKQLDLIINMLIKNFTIRKMASFDKVSPDIIVILSGGGEPTFHFDNFKYFVNKIKKYDNVHIHLVTNGMFSKENAEFIINNIDSINFSFDGIPLLQNEQRPTANGSNSFDTIYRNLKLFEKCKKVYSIRTTISENNYHYLEEMAKFIFSNFQCIENWIVESIFDSGRAHNLCINEGANFSNYFDRICDYIYEYYPDKRLINTEFSYMLKKNFCSASIGTNFWIDASGAITECSSLEKANVFRIGQIKDNKFEITGNENGEFKYYRNRMKKMCLNCIIYNICAGGCPEKMLRNENGYFIDENKKIKCKYLKKYWINKLESVYEQKETSDIKLKFIKKINGNKYFQICLRSED